MNYYYKFTSHGHDPELTEPFPLRRDLYPFAIKHPKGFILEQNYRMHLVNPIYWKELSNADLVIELYRKTPMYREENQNSFASQWVRCTL